MKRYPRRRSYTRKGSASAKQFKYIGIVQSSISTVAPNSLTYVNLVTPTSSFNNSLGLNSMKVVRIEGHLTVLHSPTFANIGANTMGVRFGHYGIGIYVDADELTSTGNTMRPLENSQTSRWMWWRTGTLHTYALGGSTQLQGFDCTHSRDKWAMISTRRYTRKFDSANDTLALVVQNSANSNDPIGFQYIMRILFAER